MSGQAGCPSSAWPGLSCKNDFFANLLAENRIERYIFSHSPDLARVAPEQGREGRGMRLRHLEHNLRRERIFFHFFRRNPLKSPDSEK
jgi:hypothetical protein